MRKKYTSRKTCYEEIQNKKLKEYYVVVQVVSFDMLLGIKPVLEMSKVYLMYGMDTLGIRTIIGVYKEDKENNRYWLNEAEKIKSRVEKGYIRTSCVGCIRVSVGINCFKNNS